jgi:hypothetical protein
MVQSSLTGCQILLLPTVKAQEGTQSSGRCSSQYPGDRQNVPAGTVYVEEGIVLKEG